MLSIYISECTTVPERRHGEVCFMAKTISVRDLINQVSKRCPPGAPIPFESWVRHVIRGQVDVRKNKTTIDDVTVGKAHAWGRG